MPAPPSGKLRVFNAARGPCAVCGLEGLPCSRCRVDYYCGKEHQRLHWQQHKKGCGALRLTSDSRLGRYVVAARDVPKGTILVRETPLVFYPQPPMEPGQMFCVCCCVELRAGPDRWAQCADCGWPVCRRDCAEKDNHRLECAAFQRANSKLPRERLCELDKDWVCALGTLRTCLAAVEQPLLLQLQSAQPNHSSMAAPVGADQRRLHSMMTEQSAYSNVKYAQSVSLLRRLGISWLPDDDLTRAAAIGQLNAFGEAADRSAGEEPRMRASVYLGLSMLEHSCLSNVTVLAEGGSADTSVLVASRDIKKGEHLAIDYADQPLRPTELRREFNFSRGFVCRCPACEDPTELGLYLGSWCCTGCRGDGKRSMVSGGACMECSLTEDAAQVLAAPQAEFDRLLRPSDPQEQGETLEKWEQFINEHVWPRGPLHATHYLIVQAKKQMTDIIGRDGFSDEGGPMTKPHALYERWESVCRDVLAVLDVLRPGINPHRNNTVSLLFNLITSHATMSLETGTGPLQPFIAESKKLITELQVMYSFTTKDKIYLKELESVFHLLVNLGPVSFKKMLRN